jgi:hypothetical protein
MVSQGPYLHRTLTGAIEMMIPSVAERTDMPQGAEACARSSIVIVAEAFWSRRIIRATYDIVSAHSGLRDRTLRAAARPTRRVALVV